MKTALVILFALAMVLLPLAGLIHEQPKPLNLHTVQPERTTR